MSRILDSYISEYVMGYSIKDGYYQLEGRHVMTTEALPNYSTDMNAAMEVVYYVQNSICNERLWGNNPHSWSITKTKDGLHRVVIGLGGHNDLPKTQHPSLPVAICLAALRAVGKDDLVDEYLSDQYLDKFLEDNQELMDKLDD